MKKHIFISIAAAVAVCSAGAEEIPTEQFQKFIAHCVESSEENLFDPEMQGSIFNWSFEGKYKVVYADKKIFSYYTEELSYTGGANGNFTVKVGSMYRVSGKKITLRSIAPTMPMQKKLLQLITLETARIFKCKVSELPQKLLAMPKLTENFYLDNTGINFVYNEYEIASKGAGAIKVLVPYTAFSVKIK
jgi:hypothetical protein